MLCGFCNERIEPGQRAPVSGSDFHHECHLRLVIGSVAHIERRCGCYVPGSIEGDPAHMTPRQAARAALVLYNAVQARN